jgi:hypothetical protein
MRTYIVLNDLGLPTVEFKKWGFAQWLCNENNALYPEVHFWIEAKVTL